MPAKKLGGRKAKPFEKVSLKYKDIFDFDNFYEILHEWFLEHEWKDAYGGDDHYEQYYGEKVSGGAKEIKIQWRLTKVPKDITYINKKPAVQFYLDIDFHLLGLKSTEVIKNGQKIKSQKAEMTLTIIPLMEMNYAEELAKNSWTKLFQGLFVERTYAGFPQQRDDFYREFYEFQNFIKQWFKLKRYMPYEESPEFYPSTAWPSHQK